MSLNFGWAWCYGADSHEDPKNRSPESLALNKAQTVFFANCLPWLLFYTGVPSVTKETIPVIVYRMRLKDSIGHWLIHKKSWAGRHPEEYLRAFIGFTTNVTWLSDAEFFRQLRKTLAEHKANGLKPLQRKAREDIRALTKARAHHVAKKSA